jgi:hypothetical protein
MVSLFAQDRHILRVDVLTKERELFPFPECKFGVIGDDVRSTIRHLALFPNWFMVLLGLGHGGQQVV